MKYLIVQDWQSTHGNHAGMKHMCDLLVAKYHGEYEMYVKECPKLWKSPKTLVEKIRWHIYDKHVKRRYINKTYQKLYTRLNNFIQTFSVCVIHLFHPVLHRIFKFSKKTKR